MPNPLALAAAPLLLLSVAPAVPVAPQDVDGVVMAQLTIRQRLVVRVPRVPMPRQMSPVPPVRFAEKKGPRCVPITTLAGVMVTASDRVDLMLSDGTRLRAKLDDDCPSLDFYSGLYLKPTPDGLVCADRDSLRSRSGGSCQIEGFKRLVAKR